MKRASKKIVKAYKDKAKVFDKMVDIIENVNTFLHNHTQEHSHEDLAKTIHEPKNNNVNNFNYDNVFYDEDIMYGWLDNHESLNSKYDNSRNKNKNPKNKKSLF